MYIIIEVKKLRQKKIKNLQINIKYTNVKMNEKCLLDVYYYIDVDGDVEFIEQSLKLQLTLNCNSHSINKLVNYKKGGTLPFNIKCKDDIIKNGLLTFNEMFKNLKLKSTNETWFFYISTGNVKEIYSNVFIVLLNRNPREQKCCYIINKDNIEQTINTNTFNIKRQGTLSNTKVASVTIREVLKSEKTITYTNLN